MNSSVKRVSQEQVDRLWVRLRQATRNDGTARISIKDAVNAVQNEICGLYRNGWEFEELAQLCQSEGIEVSVHTLRCYVRVGKLRKQRLKPTRSISNIL